VLVRVAVDLVDPRIVTERKRRPIKVAAAKFKQDQEATESLAIYDEVHDLATVALVGAWSFSAEVTVDALLDLPGGDIDEIRKIIEPLMPQLMPDFSAAGDPKAPAGS
jgi:hypothetical protein